MLIESFLYLAKSNCFFFTLFSLHLFYFILSYFLHQPFNTLFLNSVPKRNVSINKVLPLFHINRDVRQPRDALETQAHDVGFP